MITSDIKPLQRKWELENNEQHDHVIYAEVVLKYDSVFSKSEKQPLSGKSGKGQRNFYTNSSIEIIVQNCSSRNYPTPYLNTITKVIFIPGNDN